MMEENKKVLHWKDLFGSLNIHTGELPTDIEIPNSFYQDLLSCLLERDYLNRAEDMEFAPYAKNARRITWMQITRLPIHPDIAESYDLIFRWQGVLSTLHVWGYRIIFLLQRFGGETKLFIGTMTSQKHVNAGDAIEQIREATFGSMPGIGLKPLSAEKNEVLDQVFEPMRGMNCLGAITGIPSFRKASDNGAGQTLDQLAFGIQDGHGREKDYAMMVIADPINDEGISDIIADYRTLGSKIHTAVSTSLSEGENNSETAQKDISGAVGGVVGMLISAISGGAVPPVVGMRIGSMIMGKTGKSISAGTSTTINKQYLDKFAQYAEKVTDMHVSRLQDGRNSGFWNTGVYVMGESPTDVVTVMGILRSIYSGEQTYLEPIRTHLLNHGEYNVNTVHTVRDRCDLLPLVSVNVPGVEGMDMTALQWHPLGSNYQYLSTPVNTRELSLFSSLPRRDVPGIRFTKSAVRFINNPAEVTGDTIRLGRIIDTGIEQSSEYRMDPHAMVRHALVTGTTGCGKSTTCKRILRELMQKGIPALVIEPAKDDYVRWAMEMNKTLPPEKKWRIYMPGVDGMEGERFETLRLNPFEPAAVPGAPVDLLTRSENITSLLNASLPVSDVLPIIIDETVYNYMAANFGKSFDQGTMPQSDAYPRLQGMVVMAKAILRARNYEDRVRDNLSACLETRFSYLTRGMRGKILNADKSTSYTDLFTRPTIINISRIAGQKDKALIMAILTLSLYEYRISAYQYDEAYRKEAQKNKLTHITLIEEAHNLLTRPQTDAGGGSAQQAVADLFGNMLSEIRSYGQGLLIADQVPTRLIPDVIKNTNYKIVHRLTAPDDIDIMAASLALRPEQKALIPSLQVGQAIVFGDRDDGAAWVKLYRGDD